MFLISSLYFSFSFCIDYLPIAFKLNLNAHLLVFLDGIEYNVFDAYFDKDGIYERINMENTEILAKSETSRHIEKVIVLYINYQDAFKVRFEFFDSYLKHNIFIQSPIYLDEIISMKLFLLFLNSVTRFHIRKLQKRISFYQFIDILQFISFLIPKKEGDYSIIVFCLLKRGISGQLTTHKIEALCCICRTTFNDIFLIRLLIHFFESLEIAMLFKNNEITLKNNKFASYNYAQRRQNISYFQSFDLSIDISILKPLLRYLNNKDSIRVFDLLLTINNITIITLTNYYLANDLYICLYDSSCARCSITTRFFSLLNESIYKNYLKKLVMHDIEVMEENYKFLNDFQNLESLNISYKTFKEHSFISISHSFGRLKEYKIVNTKISAETLCLIFNSNLEILELKMSEISCDGFNLEFEYPIFAKCNKLYIFECRFDIAFLKLLWKFSYLECISIVDSFFGVSNNYPKPEISFFKNLKNVSIKNVNLSISRCFFSNLHESCGLKVLNVDIGFHLLPHFIKLLASNIANTVEELFVSSKMLHETVFSKILKFPNLKILDLVNFKIPKESLLQLYISPPSKTIEVFRICDYSILSKEYGIFSKVSNLKSLHLHSSILYSKLHLIFGTFSQDRIIECIHIENSNVSESDIRYISTLKIRSLILINTQSGLLKVFYNLKNEIIKETLVNLNIAFEEDATIVEKNIFLDFFFGLKSLIINNYECIL
ncbi:hypothetical protein CWI39_0878p0010 [Hamiltosporidium magnivora]|uniref:Uncharacterized protein n=1 Tax=Hamiltosporidium magnivora TaxID=148818 RepID=A0A4Q9L9K1_9MICR|nr:hypothetical protein CWI39_0878p0010 [Hamiltosporidium magnivora]